MGYNNANLFVGDGNTYPVSTTWEKVAEEQFGRTFLKLVNEGTVTVNVAFGGGKGLTTFTPQASFPLAAGAVYEPVNIPPDDIWVQVASGTGSISVWSAP